MDKSAPLRSPKSHRHLYVPQVIETFMFLHTCSLFLHYSITPSFQSLMGLSPTTADETLVFSSLRFSRLRLFLQVPAKRQCQGKTCDWEKCWFYRMEHNMNWMFLVLAWSANMDIDLCKIWDLLIIFLIFSFSLRVFFPLFSLEHCVPDLEILLQQQHSRLFVHNCFLSYHLKHSWCGKSLVWASVLGDDICCCVNLKSAGATLLTFAIFSARVMIETKTSLIQDAYLTWLIYSCCKFTDFHSVMCHDFKNLLTVKSHFVVRVSAFSLFVYMNVPWCYRELATRICFSISNHCTITRIRLECMIHFKMITAWSDCLFRHPLKAPKTFSFLWYRFSYNSYYKDMRIKNHPGIDCGSASLKHHHLILQGFGIQPTNG
jgi:hypothetical protein